MSVPEGFNPEYPECPKCGGKMWDNRKGKKNPKAPDFKCKDTECGKNGGAVWLESPSGGSSRGGGRGNGAGSPPAAPLTREEQQAGKKATIDGYFGLMALVAPKMKSLAETYQLPLTMDDVQAATYSVYGLLDKRRFLTLPTPSAQKAEEKPVPPVPEPPKRIPSPPMRKTESSPYEDDDDLPF